MKPMNPAPPSPRETRNKMEGPMSKKTNEPPKRANHNGNIKFMKPSPFAKNISNKKKGEPLEMMPSLDEPSFTPTTHFKIENAYACCNAIKTFCL
jgi:hypothetical protein